MKKVGFLISFLALSLILGACSTTVTPFDVAGEWTGTATISNSTLAEVPNGNIDISADIAIDSNDVKITVNNFIVEGTRSGNKITANDTLLGYTGTLSGSFTSDTVFSGTGSASIAEGEFDYSFTLTKQ